MDEDYDDYCVESDYESEQESEDSSEEDSSDSEESDTNYNSDDNQEEIVEQKQKQKYIGYPFITKFELTKILGSRTQQISNGAQIFVNTSFKDPYKIAVLEILEKQSPILVRRYFGNVKYKDISVNSLELTEQSNMMLQNHLKD